MVSNVLEIETEELLRRLQHLRDHFAGDPEYQALRRQLPDDWPI